MKINRKKLIRQFPKINERMRHIAAQTLESDYSYIENNLEAAVWFMDNNKLILQALYNYDRIVNLVQDEVDE